MKRDELFRDPKTAPRRFVFDGRVAEVFDDMLPRSIPFYAEQQRLISQIGSSFWKPGTDVYDLGCSTGTAMVNSAGWVEPPARVIGYDNSPEMLAKARQKLAAHGLQGRVEVRPGNLASDPSRLELENASVVSMCWTLQFVPRARRAAVLRWIHRGLVPGGVLIVAEKVGVQNEVLRRLSTANYYDFKKQHGYTDVEIAGKEAALQGVLRPLGIEENLRLFRRCGFRQAEMFFLRLPFAGFLCMKA